MRLTEPRSSYKQPRLNSPRADWMTYLLLATAILLTVAAVFIGADLWMRSPYSGSIVQALGMMDPPVVASTQLEAGESPTAQATTVAPLVGQPSVEPGVPAPNTPPPCVPPNDWGLHIVQKGNTLQTVADRYGAEVELLMRVNCLNTETIFVDQRLYVPGGLAFPMLATPSEGWPVTPNSASERLADAVPSPSDPPAIPTSTPAKTRTGAPTALARSGFAATPEPGGSPVGPAVAPGETSNPASSTPSSGPTATHRLEETQSPPESPVPPDPMAATDPTTPTSSVPSPTNTPASTTAPAGITVSGPEAGLPDAPLPPSVGSAPANEYQPAPLAPTTEVSVQAPEVPTPAATATPKSAFRVNIPNRYLNIVLLGSDKRPSSGAWRTDTMIIASIDVETNVVRLLSIPRDLWVYIPGHGYNRVNTAELWGELAKKGTGTERVKQTIHHNLGIPIHYYARVDFKGFMKIVDTVGGLDIDVACPLPDIELKPGLHRMDGKQALRFARSRKSTSDYDRGRRQRKVLLALWDQALTMDVIPRLPGLWVTMSDAFDTDLPLDQVLNLAYVGVQLKPQHILSTAINRNHVKGWRTPQGASVLLPREEKIRTLLEDFYAPKGKAELDGVDKVGVQVLNGTSRGQAAVLAASALRWDGFDVVGTGHADSQDHTLTQIIIHSGDLGAGEEIARRLEVPLGSIRDLSGIEDKPQPPALVDIQVILGKDYDPCKR